MTDGGIGNCWYTAFVGVRLLVPHAEYDERDPRVLAAKAHGLDVWGVKPRATAEDPDVDETNLAVLIGRRLALVGDGGDDAAHVPAAELLKVMAKTSELLRQAGLTEEPALWAHCAIDLGD